MNMIVKSAAVATAAALPMPTSAALAMPGKLRKLIEQWRSEQEAAKKLSRAYDAASAITKGEMPPPSCLLYDDSAQADGLTKPRDDYPAGDPIGSWRIRQAISQIKGQSAIAKEVDGNATLTLLTEPLPLTEEQIARRKRLKVRLKAALEYEREFEQRMRERGFASEERNEAIINRHWDRATRLETKILELDCADANELRAKIDFFLSHPDAPEYYDGTEIFMRLASEARDMLGAKAH